MTSDFTPAIERASAALRAAGDPDKALGMAAYMKTDMPFFGVQKPLRRPIAQTLLSDVTVGSRDEYERLVSQLWGLAHREEKYLGLDVAIQLRAFQVAESMPLYERLITEGAWWDFVDTVAIKLVGAVVRSDSTVWAMIDSWTDSDDMWLRRSAIICQIGAKQTTDVTRLLSFCAACMAEKEFFIRKAIGWALREYAKTDPEQIADFVTKHRAELSALSYREATKHIGDLV